MSPSLAEPLRRAAPRRRWQPWRPRHLVWLGPHGLVAQLRPAWGVPDAPRVWGAAHSPDQAPCAESWFEAWCAAHPGCACEVALSAHLLHGWAVADAPVAAALPWLQGCARRHWAAFHGTAALGWPVAVGGGAGGAPAIACAPDGLDLAALQAAARRHGVRLHSMQPAWAAAWAEAQRAVRHGTWRLAVFEPGAVTWLLLRRGRCHAIARQIVDAQAVASDGSLAALLLEAPGDASAAAAGDGEPRWCLAGHGLAARPPSTALCLPGLAGPLPPLRATPARGAAVPDFAAARGPHPLAWGLLATAAACALAAGLQVAEARAARDAAEARTAALQRRLAETAGAAATPGRDTRGAAEEARAAQAALRVAARLHHPWPQLLAAVESAAVPGVQLQGIAHDAAGSEAGAALRASGVASDAEALAAFVTALAASPVLADVALRQQASVPRGAAGAIAFDVQATVRRDAAEATP